MIPSRRHGEVVDVQGRPLAGVRVMVAWSDAPAPEIAAVTDADGQFGFALGAGAYELVAFQGELEIARSHVKLEDRARAGERLRLVARR